MLSKNKSFDVRTIDFKLIVSALRSKFGGSELGEKLLENVDVFGMNMICVDELNSDELKLFGSFLREFGKKQISENIGLYEFVEDVCSQLYDDERIVLRDG